MICADKGKFLSEGQHFLKKPGGAPTNVAAAIAALGGEAVLAAKVGTDPFGKYLVEVMQAFNVSTRWIFQDENFFTTFAFVSLMKNGDRDFYFNRGADGQLSFNEIDGIDLTPFSIIHFGSATAFLPGPLQSAYVKMLKKAQENDILISFDPNYRHLLHSKNTHYFIEQSWNFLKSCNFFKVSDEEAMLLTGKSDIEQASSVFFKTTSAIFAITSGKGGTLLGINNKTFIISSIPVTPVDTTVAGDAFVGAVLYQLSNNKVEEIKSMKPADWERIIANANRAGARTCEFMGAMEAFKHLSSSIFK